MSTYAFQNNIPLTTPGYNINSGNGLTQTIGGSVMGVGGGIEDYAADITYSTKPNAPVQAVNLQGNASSYQYGYGVGQAAGGSAFMTGNTMATTNGSVMGFGAGGDSAIDVTYSTKPDAQNIAFANTGINQITNTGFTTTTTQNTMTTAGGVMGFGAGGDSAIDVTYSTKPDAQNVALVNTGITTTTTQNTMATTNGSVMGFGAGGDSAIDVTYSTKPDVVNTGVVNTVYNTGMEVNTEQNLQMYNQTTLLPDKVQHIVQREYQPIIKTIIKPIEQKEFQPIVENLL